MGYHDIDTRAASQWITPTVAEQIQAQAAILNGRPPVPFVLQAKKKPNKPEALGVYTPDRVFETRRMTRRTWHPYDVEIKLPPQLGLVPGVREFFRETFGRLYERDDRPVDPDALQTWEHKAHEAMTQTSAFQALTNAMGADVELTATAANVMASAVVKTLPEMTKKQIKNQEKANLLKHQIQELEEALAADPTDVKRDALGHLQEALQKTEAKLQDYQQALDNCSVDTMRQAIRSSATQLMEDLESAATLVRAMAGTSSAVGEPTDGPSLREALKKLVQNPKLRQLLQLLGRQTRIADKCKATSVAQNTSVIRGTKHGRDLDHLVPDELAMFAHPALRVDFIYRFCNRTLRSHKFEGKEPLGKGPMIVCVDVSGSMGDLARDWAMSIAIVALMTAKREDRQFSFCTFNTRVTSEEHLAEGSYETLLTSLLGDYRRSGGGTSFDAPISWSIKTLMRSRDERPIMSKADILLLTDGLATLSPDNAMILEREKKRMGLRVMTVLLNMAPVVLPFSDKTWAVTNFNAQDDQTVLTELLS